MVMRRTRSPSCGKLDAGVWRRSYASRFTSPAAGAGCAARGGVTPQHAGHLDVGALHRRQGLEARRLELDELLSLTHGDAHRIAEPAKVECRVLHADAHLGLVVAARPMVSLDIHIDEQRRVPRRGTLRFDVEVVL